jgi:membrane protein required for colicin V production
MNGLDFAILGVMAASVLLAAAHGFVFEFFSLAGTVAGYLLAAWGYGRVAPWFLPHVKSPAIADLAGFLTIFFAVVVVVGIIARIVRKAIKAVGLRWIDRFLGAAFGLVRGVIIVTVGVMALTAFAPDSPLVGGSQLAGYFQLAGGGVSWLAPATVRQKFHEGVARLRQAASRPETKK